MSILTRNWEAQLQAVTRHILRCNNRVDRYHRNILTDSRCWVADTVLWTAHRLQTHKRLKAASVSVANRSLTEHKLLHLQQLMHVLYLGKEHTLGYHIYIPLSPFLISFPWCARYRVTLCIIIVLDSLPYFVREDKLIHITGCIQKFLDWVNNEINNDNKYSLRSNTKDYGDKTH